MFASLALWCEFSSPLSVDKKKKFSRKRQNEDEGDVTYINERNRVFNKKVCPPAAVKGVVFS